jgi:hypothetical protein
VTRTATPTRTPTGGATATRTRTRTPTPAAACTPRATPTGTRTPGPLIDPLAAPIVIGDQNRMCGSGFTAGSVVKLFVATSSGSQDFGPFTPGSVSSGVLDWTPDGSVPLGEGFGTVIVINTDQDFRQSNAEGQHLFGNPALNIPSLKTIEDVPLSTPDPSVPVANVETVVVQGTTITLGGTGFNGPLVNLFTAAGNFGPISPSSAVTSTSFDIVVPGGAPTGPGSLQVVNNPYTGNVISNSVSVPIGEALSVSSVSQTGSTVTVNGTGFSTKSVINLFNDQGGGNAVNLGGLDGNGNPKIPLTLVDSHRFTFSPPPGTVAGPAYVQVLNPPFIPFTSTGNDPEGAFMIAP